jgi:hypothetical protein
MNSPGWKFNVVELRAWTGPFFVWYVLATLSIRTPAARFDRF